MGLTLYDEKVPLIAGRTITIADTTVLKTVLTCGIFPARIDAIICCSDAAASHVIELGVYTGTLQLYLGSLSVPAGAGFAGAATVDLASLVASTPMAGLLLLPGYTLNVRLVVTLGAGELFSVAAFGGYV